MAPWHSAIESSPGRTASSGAGSLPLRFHCPPKRKSDCSTQLLKTAPVAFITAATIFCETCSISASVSVRSLGCSVIEIATDYFPASIRSPS